MVAAAATPSRTSSSGRRGQRATAPSTSAVTASTTAWLISLLPVGEPSRSPKATPTRECSATIIAASPAAARASAPPSRGRGGPSSRRRKTSRLLATAPTSRMSPQSNAHRPATPSTDGERAVGEVPVRPRHRPPAHRVGAIGELAERDLEHQRLARYPLGPSRLHRPPGGVEHVHGRQGQVGRLGEGEGHLLRRLAERGPAGRVGAAQQRVGAGRKGAASSNTTPASRATASGRRMTYARFLTAQPAAASPSTPTTTPTIAISRAVPAWSLACRRASASDAFSRWVSRSTRADSWPVVGSLAGNSTLAGSCTSSKVVGEEVNFSSTFWPLMEPVKWKV